MGDSGATHGCGGAAGQAAMREGVEGELDDRLDERKLLSIITFTQFSPKLTVPSLLYAVLPPLVLE